MSMIFVDALALLRLVCSLRYDATANRCR